MSYRSSSPNKEACFDSVNAVLYVLKEMLWVVSVLCITWPTIASCQSTQDTYFHNRTTIGSDSIYNPLHAFFSYSLDTIQIPENVGIDDFNDNVNDVLHQLRNPQDSIDHDGGFKRFFNREIFPVDFDHRRDSLAMLPNYALHFASGGMVFRRDLEWFRSHDYPYPTLIATVWSMTAEIIQEALESRTTPDSDPIADVYLFRPLSILLFSQERISRFVKRTLDPAIWPMLHARDVGDQQFLNTGISYAYRPPLLTFGKKRFLPIQA